MIERAWWYLAASFIVVIVNDGWSDRPAPFSHQLLLLPLSSLFIICLWQLLVPDLAKTEPLAGSSASRLGLYLSTSLLLLELASLAGFGYERHHFARFGYAFHVLPACLLGAAMAVGSIWIWRRRTGNEVLSGALLMYGAGLLFAIRCFPLNYLRSDMLPVILWADQRIVAHADPYATMHVAGRLYDFPYLPGMLVAFLPAVAAHVDLRFITVISIVGLAVLIYQAASTESQVHAALLIGAFLLSPFLQYRHDLYLGPHWLALTAAIVLMQRRHLMWAAVFFGISMSLYQLSWVLFPFVLLYGLRRGGVREVAKLIGGSLGTMLLVIAPFARSAMQRIASNTVGQWSRLPHALADPINLSYWLTFLVRPDQLRWVQLGVLTAIFGYCMLRGRCRTLTDTLRWMSVALAIFIALNVIVDGYFYLTLLLLLLMYTCSATGIWPDLDGDSNTGESTQP